MGKGIRLCIIGTEVINGFIMDTNTSFFAKELYALGYELKESRVIPDSREVILKTWSEFIKTGDLIINSGGLGPTDDDLTVDLLSEYLNTKPVYDQDSVRRVDYYFSKKRAGAKISREIALRQTRYPEGTIPLKNEVGLAPGIYCSKLNLIALPGFPTEIKSIWPRVLDIVKSLNLPKRKTETIPVWAMGESRLFSELPRTAQTSQVEIGVHALPVGSRLFIRDKTDESDDPVHVRNFKSQLENIFSDLIVEAPLLEFSTFLTAKNLSLSTIESCTGGLAGKLITDIPGASKWYKGGFITYANDVKMNSVGVQKITLEEHGAVSPQVAKEMAQGCLAQTKSDIAISTTGIAGPDGGSIAKPVGTAFVGIADSRENKVYTAKFYYPFGRDRFRGALVHSLFLALWQKYVYYDNTEKWLQSRFGKNFSLA